MKRHSRDLMNAYNDTINTIIDNQIYAVDAIKLEFLFQRSNYYHGKVRIISKENTFL